MVTRNFAKYCVAALVAVACTVQEPTLEQAPTTSEPVSVGVPANTVSVEFSDDLVAVIEAELAGGGTIPTKAGELSTVLQELGASHMERVFPDAGPFEPRTRKAGLHRFYVVTLSDDIPVTKAAAGLSEVPGVLSAHAPLPIRLRAVFDDPLLSNQWHLINTGTPGADVNVQPVWEKYCVGSNKVIVSVIDEPVDPTHPDLQGNLWTDEEGHTGYNFARNNYDLTIRPLNNGTGDVGHGTHVAGVISAVNNNGTGVSGLAGGNFAAGVQGVLLQSCAIFSGNKYANNGNTAEAIKWGADHGAVISQNSWGYSADDNNDGIVSPAEEKKYKSMNIDMFPEYKAAIDYFIRYAGCDNEGNQLPDSPMKGGLVFFACGNEDIDWDVFSTYEPVVAVGAFDYKGDKTFYSNYGDFVDIAAPGGGAENRTDVIWSTVPNSIQSSGYAGIDPQGYAWVGTSMACPHASGAAALIVSYFGGEGFTADDCKDILFSGLGDVIGGNKPIGRKLDVGASFDYGVKHYPAGGGEITPLPPVIELETAAVTVKAHEQVTVGFSAYDPNGHSITLSCDSGSSALVFDADARSMVITGWQAPAGTYKATARDPDGLTTSATLEYTLLENHAPEVVRSVDNMFLSGLQRVGTVSFDGLFRDVDGETLTYSVASSNREAVSFSLSDDHVSLIPIYYGESTVMIAAQDFLGLAASVTFRVVVADPDHPVTVESETVTSEAVIHIGTEKPVQATVAVYSSTGSRLRQENVTADAFNPVRLDCQSLAPGRYTVQVEYNEIRQSLRLIKY